jgi:hypothetical protein
MPQIDTAFTTTPGLHSKPLDVVAWDVFMHQADRRMWRVANIWERVGAIVQVSKVDAAMDNWLLYQALDAVCEPAGRLTREFGLYPKNPDRPTFQLGATERLGRFQPPYSSGPGFISSTPALSNRAEVPLPVPPQEIAQSARSYLTGSGQMQPKEKIKTRVESIPVWQTDDPGDGEIQAEAFPETLPIMFKLPRKKLKVG